MAAAARHEWVERTERVEQQPAANGPMSGQQIERGEQERAAYRSAGAGATNVNVSPTATQPPPAQVNVAAGYAERYPAYGGPAWAVGKANQILWFACAVLEVVLGLRFLLRLIGANPAAPFAAFINAAIQPLVWPFLGLVAIPGVRGGPVFEVATLVAMLVYFLLFLLVTQFLRLLVARPRAPI